MGRPLWFVHLLRKIYPARHSLAGLTRLPLFGRLVDALLFAGDDLTYLPKVVPIYEEVAEAEQIAIPWEVVEYFVRSASHCWIMDECICRAAEGCEDYPVDLGCLFLGEAVLQINPRLGQLVSAEEALAHAQRCRDAGLVQVIGRNRLDSVWLGAKPADRLLTICHCCPCCCLWGTIPQLHPVISARVQRMPGVQVRVTGRCMGCGLCEGACFVQAIHVVNGRATIDEACRGCGRCVEACPHQAIEIALTDKSYVEEVIRRLAGLVDVSSDGQEAT